jgi:RNA-directed DNA polymerase
MGFGLGGELRTQSLIDHAALMDRVRSWVKDKRVLALVKSFLKAGLLTELGET